MAAAQAAVLLPLTLLLLSAWSCSTGFDRAEMREVMRRTVTLPEMPAGTPETKPAASIPAPFRLALFFAHREFPARQAITPADWLSQDREALLRALADLQHQSVLRDTLVLAPSSVQEPTLAGIRNAAARYGADAVVIVTGSGSVDRSNNGYALLYPTILGAYLAPGTVSNALFLIDGSLWDVRTGWFYGTVAAEGHARLAGPAMSVEDREALMQAKRAALESFGTRLVEQMRRLPSARP